MRGELESSFDFSRGVNHFELRTDHGVTTMSHEEEVCIQYLEIYSGLW